MALGLRYLGVLLMGSLIITPAATSKRVARTLTGMLVASVVVAVLATVIGAVLADAAHRPTGTVIISFATATFLASLPGYASVDSSLGRSGPTVCTFY